MISYTIEKRNGDYYIITNETHKGNVITINLSSIINTEEVQIMNNVLEKTELVWVLRYNNIKNELFIDLLIDINNGYTFSKMIDIHELITECVSCIKDNKLLDNCDMIMSAINSLFDTAYKALLEERIVIYSNKILEGRVIVYNDNKVSGYASRFVINKNIFSILEYVGKPIGSNNPEIKIYYDNYTISIMSLENHSDMTYNDNNANQLKYYTFKGMEIIYSNVENENDTKDLYKLNVSKTLKSPEQMYKFILNHNTIEEITKYKISMKPALKLIDINNFMIKEFNR